MKISKRFMEAIFITSIITISFFSVGAISGVQEIKSVNAATITTNTKIQQLKNSIENNSLSLKNVETWQGYIKEAREIADKVTDKVIKESYYAQIDEAESVVSSVIVVSQLENSMSSKPHVIGNVEAFTKELNLCISSLSEITDEYEESFYKLYARTIKCSLSIDKIIVKNNA